MKLLLGVVLLLAQLGQTPAEMIERAGRIGVTLDKRGGRIVVDEVSPGTSAAEAGLQVGDQLLRIDFANTESMSESTASGRLRGLYGSRLRLTVLPRGQMMPRTVEVVRDVKTYGGADSGIVGDVKEKGTAEEAARAPILEAELQAVEVTGGPHDHDAVRPAFERSTADVATCVGAVGEMLPNDLEAVAATFTFRREGTVSVRTDPPSADLASCLGRKTAGWKLPKAAKEPTVVRASWIIDRR